MGQGNPYQEKYWTEMVQLKAHVLYLDEYLVRTERMDRTISMFLAIASSASIGTWAVWQKYQLVWAFIIAFSQVLNAVKPYLPYKKRLETLSGLRRDFEEILLLVERRWYDVAEGNLSQEQIHELHSEIREKKSRAQHKHLGLSPLPGNVRFMEKAEQEATLYFRNFYRMED